MNKKRWFWASVVVFVIVTALEYLFNTVCLKDMYAATSNLWRTQENMKALMPYLWLGYLVTAFLFTYIYAKGYEAKPSPLAEGLRCGLIVGLFVAVPMATVTYVVMPIPGSLSFYWFIMGLFEFLAAGAAAGLIYKKA